MARQRRGSWGAPGVGTAGMRSRDFMGTRENRQVQHVVVGSDKLATRGRPDDLAVVGLAHSTPRPGEPATWGRGQRWVICSEATWAPCKGRVRSSMQREGQPAMATEFERIAAKSCWESESWLGAGSCRSAPLGRAASRRSIIWIVAMRPRLGPSLREVP